MTSLKKTVIYSLFLIFSFVSCSENNSTSKNVNSYDFDKNNLINEPYFLFFSAIIGYLNETKGALLNINERSIIEFPDGKKDYFVSYELIDNSIGSISFRFIDIINEEPTFISMNPSYWVCLNENSFCYICKLTKPSAGDPLYSCGCSDSQTSGPGLNSCSLGNLPGPDVPLGFVNTYSTIGTNILESLSVSNYEVIEL